MRLFDRPSPPSQSRVSQVEAKLLGPGEALQVGDAQVPTDAFLGPDPSSLRTHPWRRVSLSGSTGVELWLQRTQARPC